MARDDLSEMLTKGPASDIFRAEETLKLIKLISTHAEAINASSFDPVFATLQAYSVEHFILAVTRLFQEPGQRYQLRSLPGIIDWVIEHAADLPVREPAFFDPGLQRLGIEAPNPSLADEQLTRAVLGAVRDLLPRPDTNAELNALKALRDKRIGHPEHIPTDAIPQTTWERAELLLEPAQQVVGIMGAYTSTAYVDADGKYFISSDSQVASMATRRLLRELGIIEQ